MADLEVGDFTDLSRSSNRTSEEALLELLLCDALLMLAEGKCARTRAGAVAEAYDWIMSDARGLHRFSIVEVCEALNVPLDLLRYMVDENLLDAKRLQTFIDSTHLQRAGGGVRPLVQKRGRDGVLLGNGQKRLY
jgi:hypothetical protein